MKMAIIDCNWRNEICVLIECLVQIANQIYSYQVVQSMDIAVTQQIRSKKRNFYIYFN